MRHVLDDMEGAIMAHTDRDHPSYKRFWDWHEKHCGCRCHEPGNPRWCYWNCSCLKADPLCPRGEWWIGPVPSSWKRAQRKAERNKLRQQLSKTRNGRIDYDDLPSGEGKMYRRPYYW